MNFDRYATGYAWLDKLTLPFWTLYSKWHEWRFYRFLGKGDAKRGREIMRRAVSITCTVDGCLCEEKRLEDSATVVFRERWQ